MIINILAKTKKLMQKKIPITHWSVRFGADPEFFFLDKSGEVVGAELVLPKEGLSKNTDAFLTDEGQVEYVKTKMVVIDGVQGEFNIVPATCRQTFASNISNAVALLEQHIQKEHPNVRVHFGRMVTLSEAAMDKLSPDSKQFGCAPSKNIYRDDKKLEITDASKYYHRSAGGHIHLGHGNSPTLRSKFQEAVGVVRMLDILVGNTCVLLDRDSGNVERRKVYGRAGEYRLPNHGLEYRTLSNFWLRNYKLMSLVLALSRQAVSISLNKEAEAEILKCVDMQSIRDAINNNDFELAYDNFNRIKDVLRRISVDNNTRDAVYPLEGKRMDSFERLVESGIDHWFKNDKGDTYPWLHESVGAGAEGWETFADLTLRRGDAAPTTAAHIVTSPVTGRASRVEVPTAGPTFINETPSWSE